MVSGSNQVLPTLTLLSRQLWDHEEEAVADMMEGEKNEKKWWLVWKKQNDFQQSTGSLLGEKFSFLV